MWKKRRKYPWRVGLLFLLPLEEWKVIPNGEWLADRKQTIALVDWNFLFLWSSGVSLPTPPSRAITADLPFHYTMEKKNRTITALFSSVIFSLRKLPTLPVAKTSSAVRNLQLLWKSRSRNSLSGQSLAKGHALYWGSSWGTEVTSMVVSFVMLWLLCHIFQSRNCF